MPVGSLIKPFTALAYADTHRFTYPAFTCRGSADGCWLPAGHGRVGIAEAVAGSCNAYFRQLAQRTAPDALVARLLRFGMRADLAAATPAAMVGFGDALKLAPSAVIRGYLELVSRAGQPGVSPIVQGMLASARTGTGRAVGAAIGGADALVKTGTAPCSHSPRAISRWLHHRHLSGGSSSHRAADAGARPDGRRDRGFRRRAADERDGGAMMRRATARSARAYVSGFSGPTSACALPSARTEVRVGVFGLFHPRALVVSAAGGVISLRGDRHSCVLRGGEEARIDLDGGSVRVACAAAVFSTGSPARDGADGPIGGSPAERAWEDHAAVPRPARRDPRRSMSSCPWCRWISRRRWRRSSRPNRSCRRRRRR